MKCPENVKLIKDWISNEYITQARYPSDLPFESIGKDDAREAIEAADKIEKFVLKEIDILFENKI